MPVSLQQYLHPIPQQYFLEIHFIESLYISHPVPYAARPFFIYFLFCFIKKKLPFFEHCWNHGVFYPSVLSILHYLFLLFLLLNAPRNFKVFIYFIRFIATPVYFARNLAIISVDIRPSYST
jgi:hypothetical protein